jgi:hypothetical protein
MITSATRRGFLFILGAPFLFAASDFWNKKGHDEWSSQEILQLTTKSPWAKDVRVELKAANRGGYDGGAAGIPGTDAETGAISQRRMAGADSGGIGPDAPGPSGMGRGTGPDSGMPDALGGRRGDEGIPISALAAKVRWESAQPLIEALRTKLPPEFADRYVISVSGIPALHGKEFLPGDEAMMDRFKASASLQVKGKSPVQAGAIRRSASGMWFGFAKEFLPLAASDKDLTFTLNTGQLSLKARFDPKEMLYGGKLAV